MAISAGEWIRIPMPGGGFPAQISIDGRDPVSAFIDRIDGGVVAALRCPKLRRGRHSATATSAGKTWTLEFEVI